MDRFLNGVKSFTWLPLRVHEKRLGLEVESLRVLTATLSRVEPKMLTLLRCCQKLIINVFHHCVLVEEHLMEL